MIEGPEISAIKSYLAWKKRILDFFFHQNPFLIDDDDAGSTSG